MSKPLKKLSRRLFDPINLRRALRRLRDYHRGDPSLEDGVAMAMNMGTHGSYRVRTLQIYSEILSLARSVASLKPRVILEIGTYSGGTAFLWSQIASELVLSCDMNDQADRRLLFEAFPPPGSRVSVTTLQGNSHDPSMVRRVKDHLRSRSVDFLFIDGDHSLEGVRADFEDYAPLVRTGGLVAFHDIVEKQPEASTQVQRFWLEVKDQYESEAFVHDEEQVGFGIGLLRM